MTKEETINVILQNYKDCKNNITILSNLCEGIVCNECPFNSDRCIFYMSIELIKRLIKAEEHQETNFDHYIKNYFWIPCSERLPDKFGKYLVNVGQPYLLPRYRWTDIAFFVDGRWHDVQEGTKVFAWMPLPKPYRGNEE